jgi:hypothetical protein
MAIFISAIAVEKGISKGPHCADTQLVNKKELTFNPLGQVLEQLKMVWHR